MMVPELQPLCHLPISSLLTSHLPFTPSFWKFLSSRDSWGGEECWYIPATGLQPLMLVELNQAIPTLASICNSWAPKCKTPGCNYLTEACITWAPKCKTPGYEGRRGTPSSGLEFEHEGWLKHQLGAVLLSILLGHGASRPQVWRQSLKNHL